MRRQPRSRKLSHVRVISLIGGLALVGIVGTLRIAGAAAPDNSLSFTGTTAAGAHVIFGAIGANTDKLNASNFTLEVWFNRNGAGVGTDTSASGGGGFQGAIPLLAKGRGEGDNLTTGTNLDINYFLGLDSAGHLAVDYEEGFGQAAPSVNHGLAGTTVIPLTGGGWHHAAATFNGSTMRLFLDGKLEASNPNLAGRLPQSMSIQRTSIGSALVSNGTAGGFFAGAIDEVRIWNTARTWEQIRDNKDDELTSGTGLIGRWGLDEGAGGSVADDTANPISGTLAGATLPTWNTLQYNFPQDATPPAAPAGAAAVARNGAVDLTWTANTESDLAGYNVYRGTSPGVPTNGTPLNGDTLLAANAPSYTDSTASNGTTYYYAVTAVDTANNKGSSEASATPSPSLTALRFNGTNQYVTFGPAPNLAATSFTLETWFKRTGAGTPMGTGSGGLANNSALPLVTKGCGQGETPLNVNTNYWFGLDSATNRLVADFEDNINGGNHPATAAAGASASPGEWHHGAVTYDGTTYRFYLDGAFDRAVTLPGSFTPESSSIQHAAIGSALPSTGGSCTTGYFQGVMDEARIWNVVRSPAEILASKNQELVASNGLVGRWGLNEGTGTVAGDSTGTTDGTLTGSPTWVVGQTLSAPPAGPYALRFNGSSQYVTFGAAPGLASPTFTLETWFKWNGGGVGQQTGTGGLTSSIPLITKGRNETPSEGTNADMNYFLGIDTATQALAVDFEEAPGGAGPAGQNHPFIAGTPVSTNVWHHAAATYDGTTWRVYLDGRLDGSDLVGQPARGDSIQHAGLGTAMTSGGTAGGFFQGVMDEARIWDHALTGEEIRLNKNLTSLSDTSGLLGRWHLDENVGNAVADSSDNGANGTGNGGAHVAPYGFGQDTTAPAAVQGLSATPGFEQIVVNWNDSPEADAAGYNIWRSTTSPVITSGTPLNGDDLLTTSAYTDDGLITGLTYYYAVKAVDGSNNSSTAAQTSTTLVPTDPQLVGAGDIANCGLSPAEDGAPETAALISGISGTVFTAGDNVYDNGLLTEFQSCYEQSWGAFKNRTSPAPGNHDYGNGGNNGGGYFDYFNGVGQATGPAGDRTKGYYSYDVGDYWHIVVLNSECYYWSICAGGPAAQEAWLESDLTANASRNVFAFMHKPRWSSGNSYSGGAGLTVLQPLWQLLYDHGAEALFVGHDHHYERFAPQNADGQLDNTYGVREFIVGSGGAGFHALPAGNTPANSEFKNNTNYGVMKLVLHQSSYDWQFVPVTAGALPNEHGTVTVHGPPPDTTPPVVMISSVDPPSLGSSDPSTDVTWHANEDGSYSVRLGGTTCGNGTEVANGSYTAPGPVVTTVSSTFLADGDNTIRVCVTDAANNTGADTAIVSKNLTPPANALSFDGVNDYVDFGPATSELGSQTFTIETWFKRTGTGVSVSTGTGGVTAIPLVTKGVHENDTPANVNMNYFLGIRTDDNSNHLVADFEDTTGGDNHPISGTTAIPANDNIWHHAAAVFDNTTLTWRLYLDGVLETRETEDGTPEATSIQHAAFGTAINSSVTPVTEGAFRGVLDEVRIWNVARTGAQIRANKNTETPTPNTGLRGHWHLNQSSGNPVDSSGHNVAGTLSGATWTAGNAFSPDTTAPGAPSGLDGTPDDQQITLTWDANAEPDIAGYDLYRGTSPGVSTAGTPINGADLITGTTYTNTSLTNGTTYYYKLIAVDSSNNRSPASAEDSATPVPGDPQIVGAGDIADCTRTQDTDTAALINGISGGVFTLGDNVYQNGLSTEFTPCYNETWGAFKNRTRPAPGNHDYGNGSNNGSGYFDYFNGVGQATGPAGDRTLGYYSYDVGPYWHMVVANSECYYYNVCGGASIGAGTAAQESWLRGDLAANASKNVMMMWHKPRWSSGTPLPVLQPLWQIAYDYGVEAVFVGHDHHYEQFAPMNSSGALDTSFGVREFIVGTGGASLAGISATPATNSQARNNTTYGVMKLKLHQFSYDWQFIPTTVGGFTDSGTQSVHSVPSQRPVIDSVTISPTAPTTNQLLTATVTSHDPNGGTITHAYQWLKGGVAIPSQTGSTLNLATAGNGDRGDVITVRVTGSDETGSGSPLTSSGVTVANSPPSATVSLSPDPPGTNAILTATATKSDPDNNTVTLTYVWKTNGTVKKTTSNSASLTDTFDLSVATNGDAGQTVSVEVTPSDGTASGTLATDSVVVASALAPPTGLTASLTTNAVVLDWANNTEPNLAGYNVYRGSAVGGPFTKLNTAVLTASAYNDTTASAQATSYYQVKAVDTGAVESGPAAISATRGIAFRSASSQKGSGSSLTIARPAGVAANDVLLAVIDIRSAGTITPPSGWTLVRSDVNGTALKQSVFVHNFQSSDPAYTWTFGGSQTSTGVMLAYAGVNTAGPIDVTSGKANASSTSIATNAVNTLAPNAAVVGLFGTLTNASITPPATMAEHAEVSGGSGKAKLVTEAADVLQATPGSTGTPTATGSAAAANIGQIVALRPSDVTVPPDTTPPSAPTGLTATVAGPTQINLSWVASNDDRGISGYEVTRDGQVVGTPTAITFNDVGVSPNVTHTYTVRAFDTATPTHNPSGPSDPASATTSSIVFHGATTKAVKNATTLSLTKPSGAQTGDVLIASIDVRDGPIITPPGGGWTPVLSTASGTSMTKASYWHVVGAPDAGPYVWTFSAPQTAAGTILAYGGVDATTPIDASNVGTGSGTSIAAGSVNVTSLGSVLVSLVGVSTNAAITPPAGQTERAEIVGGSGSARVVSEASDSVQAGATTGNKTATGSKTGAWVHQLLLLRPAP